MNASEIVLTVVPFTSGMGLSAWLLDYDVAETGKSRGGYPGVLPPPLLDPWLCRLDYGVAYP